MRILVAGLGAVGQRHARNLRTLCGDSAELLAFRQRRLTHVVTDALQADASRNVERELGIIVFEDLQEALDARPEAAFVCTPTNQHVGIAQRAAEAGCHLFIEKPVSHTLEGVEALRRAVASKGLVAAVGCQWRYHPCVRWLRNQLQVGAFGRLVSADIEYAEYLPDWHPYEDYRLSYAARAVLGGGVVLTQIHDYDLAWWLFGPFRAVSASGGHLSTLDIDVEDTVDARLEGDGPAVRIRQTFAARPARRLITVVGDRGTAVVDLVNARVTTDAGVSPGIEVPGFQRNDMFIDLARQFVACAAGADASVVRLDDGIAVLRVAVAVRESMHAGRRMEIA